MRPGALDINIRQDDVFELYVRLRLTDVNGAPGAYMDLTGQTPKAQIRDTLGAVTVAASMTCTPSNQTDPNTVGGVYFKILGSVTSTLTAGTKVWDFQLTDSAGDSRTYLAGNCIVTQDVTR